jgi:hypothetical protein
MLLGRPGRLVRVAGVAVDVRSEVVYNLEVEELHCYAVGRGQILVHNGPASSAGAPGADGAAPKARQRNNLRRQYMGQNPKTNSRTYRSVIERMRAEGKIVGEGADAKVVASDGTLIPLDEAELSHTKDAVKYWNETGKYWGPRHPKVREFMLDPKNYVLDKPGPNRSAGGKLKGDGYDPPSPLPDGPPQPP